MNLKVLILFLLLKDIEHNLDIYIFESEFGSGDFDPGFQNYSGSGTGHGSKLFELSDPDPTLHENHKFT